MSKQFFYAFFVCFLTITLGACTLSPVSDTTDFDQESDTEVQDSDRDSDDMMDSSSEDNDEEASEDDNLNINEDPMANENKSWDEPPVNQLEDGKNYFATIKTNKGDIKLDLYQDDTPITVNNFVFLANEGFYDGVIFHRIIENFMAQGGDPTGTGMGGPGYRFEDEITAENSNEPYTISMANAGPDTNGSQFFINFVDNGFLNDKHTVFGKVVEGMDVVDALNGIETEAGDRPVSEVVIESVEITTS